MNGLDPSITIFGLARSTHGCNNRAKKQAANGTRCGLNASFFSRPDGMTFTALAAGKVSAASTASLLLRINFSAGGSRLHVVLRNWKYERKHSAAR
jgi:hypothetical protein